jgi:hypothetical protein
MSGVAYLRCAFTCGRGLRMISNARRRHLGHSRLAAWVPMPVIAALDMIRRERGYGSRAEAIRELIIAAAPAAWFEQHGLEPRAPAGSEVPSSDLLYAILAAWPAGRELMVRELTAQASGDSLDSLRAALARLCGGHVGPRTLTEILRTYIGEARGGKQLRARETATRVLLWRVEDAGSETGVQTPAAAAIVAPPPTSAKEEPPLYPELGF